MGFLQGSLTWWLVGAVVASIPLIIHLLHRQRTEPIPWGAMQFLLQTPLFTRQRRKVENWLLMLLRIAALAALVILLARPTLSGVGSTLTSARPPTDVAVVLDHSLSAGRRAGDSTAFAQGVAAARKIAETLRPRDTLSIVLAEHRPTALTPFPVPRANVGKLRDELGRLQPGTTDASVPQAVAMARDLLAKGRNPSRLIVVVSDEQKASWNIGDHAAWVAAAGGEGRGSAKLVAVPVEVDEKVVDLAVGGVRISPAVVGVDRPVRVAASVSNLSAQPAPTARVSLSVEGRIVQSQDLPGLPAGQSQTVQFDYAFTRAGSQWVKVEIDAADALAADNEAVAAVNVREKLPVLIIDGSFSDIAGFRDSAFLEAALRPEGTTGAARSLFDPKIIGLRDSATAKFDDYAVVIVNDVPRLPPAALDRLAAHVRSGHGAWFIFGRRTDAQFVSRELGRVGLLKVDAAAARRLDPDERPPVVQVAQPTHPSVALVASARRDALADAETRGWWPIKLFDEDATAILTTAGGEPLTLERPVGRAGGRVAFWTTSADRQWNNWPALADFVPLVNETTLHLAAAGATTENRALEAGEPIEWIGPAKPAAQSARITRPDGKQVDAKPAQAAGRSIVRYTDTAAPGVYQLRLTPTELPQPLYFGVGLDRRELDSAKLSEADFRWLADRGFLARDARVNVDQAASAGGETGGGAEVWPFLAVALLAMLVFETFMTWRMARHQSGGVETPPPLMSPTVRV